ncbi:hypothetical protein [Massilia horti]|uniref:Uncharacterized protein n=1 Tax=Massilia horti TaxID=2562153 RepID=A0A4Y9SQY3_9BURK|nr:hypothetical protein [Massilia horti]TFW27759.1 hypothetical protein E4O92_23140 [Massilia horti]
MNIDTVRQSLEWRFTFTYIISFVALCGYKVVLDRNYFRKHLSMVRFGLAVTFLACYLYGMQAVLNAGSNMEDAVNKVVQDSPGTQELLRAHCQRAWVNDVTGTAKNGLSDLSPCITLIAVISKEQKDIADGKAALPSSLMTLLIAFLSAFQGGLCATFMYAWATTVREPFDTRD